LAAGRAHSARWAVGVAGYVAVWALSVCAQTDAKVPSIAAGQSISPPSSFDVASIRLNTYDHSGRSHLYSSPEDSQFRAINATAMQLLQFAYALPDSRVLGAPDWLMSAKFDIQAKGDEAADQAMHALPNEAARLRKRQMVQVLLAERFHLAAHTENRVLPVYELVIDRKGLKFSPSEDGPKHVDTSARSGNTTLSITHSSTAMADLAQELSHYVDREVVDKTGLEGIYSITLKFAADDLRAPFGARSGNAAANAADAPPPVFTALPEQLGLALKPAKAPIEVLVIEHIEMPSEN
jgi:uncharacterized protein (TIGR03435 family)